MYANDVLYMKGNNGINNIIYGLPSVTSSPYKHQNITAALLNPKHKNDNLHFCHFP